MDRIPTNIVVFHCRNLRLFKGDEHKKFARSRPGISLISIPCSGKVEAHHILRSLASGAEGVLVLACSEEACHYMEGSARSHKRADYAKSWLTRLGIQPERVRFIHFRPMDIPGLDKELLEFATTLESFGTIPALTKIAG